MAKTMSLNPDNVASEDLESIHDLARPKSTPPGPQSKLPTSPLQPFASTTQIHRPKIRFSIDASTFESNPMSLLNRNQLTEGDNLITGLRRIRQSNQAPTSSLVSGGSFINASGLLSQPPTQPGTRMNSLSLGPPGSPLLGSYEDLAKFPTESLHSFSFAQHSEDILHSRQNIVKRGLEFMKDRLGMSTLEPRDVARARLEGGEEGQQAMELLHQANLLTDAKTPMLTGPATGPADVQGNPFDRDFAFDTDGKSEGKDTRSEGASSRTGTNDSTSTSKTTPPPSRGPTLRRTNTDIAVSTVKSQLNEALAKPYRAESSTSYSMLPSLGSTAALSGHAPRNVGGSEAIFTTTSKFPWTILAANDMACLIFGVTKHEVRKIGILELVGEESREWLSERLQSSETTPFSSQGHPHSQHGSSHATTSLLQNGELYQNKIRRVRSTGLGNYKHQQNKSRGVLLCGDVVPIQKRNGNVGAASLWVKEKKGGLIWVVEEISEDCVTIQLERNIVKSVEGKSESIFGDFLNKPPANGLNVLDILPSLPQNHDFTINCEEVNSVQHYTACNRGIRIPCKITARKDGEQTRLKITAFPHIAGIMVVSPTTLNINSTNSVFSAALFGQPNPVGTMVTNLLPYFGKVLQYVVDEEQVELVDGMVVPEHLFRKAYQSVALREGKKDPASIFYGPTGVPAIHRDGSELRVDIQMRVAGSEGSFAHHEHAIIDDSDDEMQGPSQPELVYAVWVTYSRHFHAVSLAKDASAPALTRQMTPPRQVSPGQPSPPLIGSPGIEPTAAVIDQQLVAAMDGSGTNTPSSAGEEDLNSAISPIAQYMARKKKTIADFVILEDMGQGAYGQVKLARYKRGSRKRVVLKYVTKKRILVDTWTRDRKLGTVPLEIHVLNYLKGEGLKHPNIVEMTDFFEDDINYYIEMVPHGLPGMDLFDYIELKINMDEMEARSIFIQVVRAVHHLHTKAKVVHRDIKDENVVLDGNGRVKLIDFGSAAFIAKGPFDVFVGTIDYAAPEVLQGKSYRGKEQDIWALGVLLYTICYKENPFYNVDEIMDHEIRIPYLLSEPCLDLIRKMLDRDVDRRISIEEVIEHPWFDGLADMDEGLEMRSSRS